jgi:hypothetical protein
VAGSRNRTQGRPIGTFAEGLDSRRRNVDRTSSRDEPHPPNAAKAKSVLLRLLRGRRRHRRTRLVRCQEKGVQPAEEPELTSQKTVPFPDGDSRPALYDKRTLLLRRSGIHVSAAVEMVINFRGGADHAAVKEHVESRGLQVLLGQRARPIIFPQNSEQERGDHNRH